MKKILLLLVLTISVLGGLYYVLIFSPRLNTWDGRSRFTVVELSSPVRVLSFDPATGRGIKLSLPDNLWVDTQLGRGKFPLSSISAAGSHLWAAGSIADTLGIFYQGELSGLNIIDKVKWWWWARKIAWQEIDMVEAGLVNYLPTADNTKQGILSSQWDNSAREWFGSLVLSQEKLAVHVVNTTEVSGLAATAARAIDSSGLNVVEVTNSSNLVDKCQLASPKDMQKNIGVALLRRYYDCDWQEGDALTLYLGKQYQKVITGNN